MAGGSISPPTLGKMLWNLSLSSTQKLPILLGDLEKESRMITFNLSVFWAYEIIIFCKILTFTEAALLSGTPAGDKNLSKSPELKTLSSK